MKGYVKAIKDSYGFIAGNDGIDYFFHKNDLINCNLFQLDEYDDVEFTPTFAQRGDRASNVRKIDQIPKSVSNANPGINPAVILDDFNEDERKIVAFLASIFYVTNGGRSFKINDSIYKYCLIKPTDYFRTTFLLNREIVVIFSDYVSFEPRTLDAAPSVYKRIESNLRCDKGLSILISHDAYTEEKLASLLKDNNYNQIIVPFTYQELLSDKTTLITVQDRFKKYLFERDLFKESSPIRNEVFFFGRRDYLVDIVSKCKNNTHCGIFGLRRSGKTSMLYAVKDMLEKQGYRTVFIPCEGDLRTLNWKTALCKVVLNIYKEFDINASNIHESDYLTDNTTTYFEEDMNEALSGFSTPVTLMFDEIEAITFDVLHGENEDEKWLDGVNFDHFWSVIKGYYTKYPKRISVLVAGTNPAINEIPTITKNNVANPMFKQLSESNQGAYLPAFSTEDTKNMVNTLGGYMGISFDNYTINQLTNDCGGHPYLMRELCSHINNYIRSEELQRPCVVTKAIYDHVTPEFEKSNDASSFFLMILNILMTSYPKEFNTLKVLALEGDEIISQTQDKTTLFHLIGYGLVELNQGHYAIKYNFVTNFLRGKYAFERTGLSIEEQKQEINVRINRAEIQLRDTIRRYLRFAYKEDKAKDIVIQSMERNPACLSHVDNARQLTYKQLFDPSVNKAIYFSLLRDLIIDNIDLFDNIEGFEDTAEVKYHLNVINNSRQVPSHSYSTNTEKWSWNKFLEFRSSIKWLEEILDNTD